MPRPTPLFYHFLWNVPFSSLSSLYQMAKTTIMKRIVALFKKTHEKKQDPAYPTVLENTYKVTKKILGVGSFAVVKECIHKSTQQPYALKIILKKAIAGNEDGMMNIKKILR